MEVVIIVAGGSGSRMRSDYPKQFLELSEKPILMHTIRAFHDYSTEIRIVLVLPETSMELWKDLCNKHKFTIPHQVTAGGSSRTESVRNGLEYVEDQDFVAIHDGVRPFISREVISKSFKTAKVSGNAIVCVRMKDSLRQMNSKGESVTADRSMYRSVQTPQVFKGSIIKESYQQIEMVKLEFTDDASVAEHAGVKLQLIEGDYSNIKITTPEDMAVAEALLNYLNR